jgi:hypothetical protein
MTDKNLIRICTQFRAGVLGGKNEKSKDKCLWVSSPLCSYLNFLKVKCRMIEYCVTIGENITYHHCILLDDGRIIDPTADQFNEIRKLEMPKVYLGEKPSHYMEIKKRK